MAVWRVECLEFLFVQYLIISPPTKLLCQGNINVICLKVYMYIPAVNEMHFVIV